MKEIKKSQKLNHVCYDIRGPVMEAAARLESQGHRIVPLNTGNPGRFGFSPPENMRLNIIQNLSRAEPYVDSQGMPSARQVILEDCRRKGFPSIDLEDIWVGNGVSEMISLVITALVDNGDEILIPSPDYPLWTATVTLAGGRPVPYRCDEAAGWQPDLQDIRTKIGPRTKGLVIINPNNPTGAVYERPVIEGLIQIAREHSLILLSDEIYDRILYDGDSHCSPACLTGEIPVITFNGLSKVFLAAGYRAGWFILSGPKGGFKDFREGLSILANMRLCGNTFSQLAVEAGFEPGIAAIKALVSPGGRLYEQREAIYRGITSIPGLSCAKPRGALYLFPRIDVNKFSITNDETFVLDFLREKKVLLVHGRGFNWPEPDHFRIVFLPPVEELLAVVEELRDFLTGYNQGLPQNGQGVKA
ncbi:MAG: pyridoxal phosphate-dependent aminotransferase [Spirochaetales bacterium]|jgi:alanine-synthesizing transaminase|nr:pyridoxal phosphate-dependent aminotransferase [Spirochaetales bacterium]